MLRASPAVGPLHATAGRAATTWLAMRVGLPADATGWTGCAGVDAAHMAAWEARVAGALTRTYGRSDPRTATGYTLDFYAGLPGTVGGGFFRHARRVPRLGREELAFTCRPDDHRPNAVALLDERFWCLPDDPAANHPAATVVDDEHALAAVLRAQVRAHADDFLAGYRPGARLPRRHLIGAFFDGLDTGVWYGGDPGPAALPGILTVAATVLPDGTGPFRDRSTLHRLVDDRGREHVSRRRIGCCYYYKVAADGLACRTCPRVDDAERARRYGLE